MPPIDAEMCSKYLFFQGSLEACMHFGILIDITNSHSSFLLVIREMSLLVEGN